MATKKAKNVSIFDNVDTIIAKAKTINKEAIKTTDMLVEEGIATGTKFQKIFAKSVTKGTDLLEKQQDMAVENLEEIKNLYVAGTKRFRKLFNIDQLEDEVKDIAKKVNKQADKARKTAKKAIKEVENTIDEVEDDITDTKNSVVKSAITLVKGAKAKATSIITKVSEEVTEEAKAIKKQSKKKVTATAKKTQSVVKTAAPKATKKAAPVKKTVEKTVEKVIKTATTTLSDLKAISGVGPKLESMLKEAGFNTITDIATAKEADLQAMLDKAGARYKMFDPKVWIKNAKAIAK